MAVAAKKPKSKKKSAIKLQPLGHRIVVERDLSEDTTAGGILLPGSAQDKPSRGVVLAIGEGRLLADGSRSPLQVQIGDRVLFTSYGPNEVKISDEEFLLMSEDDVLAIIE